MVVEKNTNNVMENKVQRPIQNICIVGTGKVASFWAKNLKKTMGPNVYALGSSPDKTLDFCNTFSIKEPKDFNLIDLFILCVQDRNIDKVVSFLPKHAKILVMSGTYQLRLQDKLSVGVLYPLQTFGNIEDLSFENTPFLSEMEHECWDSIKTWLQLIGLEHEPYSEIQRLDAHLCAVMINNFTHHVIQSGLKEAENRKLDLNLFKPLINQTINNSLIINNLQTGPASREDLETMAKHLDKLSGANLELYRFLSQEIIKKQKQRHEL